MRLTLAIDGQVQVDRTLARFQDRVVDARSAFQEMAQFFANVEVKQMGSEGAHGPGGRWAPLAASTVAFKAAHFPGTKILERTGALRDSLTKLPLGVQDIGPRSMEIGSGVPYARFHQNGTGRMPARPPIDFTENARRSFVRILQQFLMAEQFLTGEHT